MAYPYTEKEPDDQFFLTLKPSSWEGTNQEFIALCKRTWKDAEREMENRQGRQLEALARLLTDEMTNAAARVYTRREDGRERKRYARRKRVRWEMPQ